jgi:selenocysteine lyase/cysteine desulfurase
MLDIGALRAETPGTHHVVHLNNAGASLMPTPVIDAITNHITLEAQVGGYEAADASRDAIRGFYTATAELLNTSTTNIAATASATDAYARALSAIPFKKGDVILTTLNDYVSNQIAFLSLKKRFGIRIVRAEDDPEGGVFVDDMAAKIKSLRPRVGGGYARTDQLRAGAAGGSNWADLSGAGRIVSGRCVPVGWAVAN